MIPNPRKPSILIRPTPHVSDWMVRARVQQKGTRITEAKYLPGQQSQACRADQSRSDSRAPGTREHKLV
jgi:hypothetical protein